MPYPTAVPGIELGVAFPPSLQTLESAGPSFLTDAFRASGVMSRANRVIQVTQFDEFLGGGMGRKALLSVTYAKHEPELSTQLFVKFPRDFGDPLRELWGPLMEPEVRFALLSRRKDFPIRVPKCYFADYHKETVSGILITERIGYGEGNIEERHEKCLDYAIPDLRIHYDALVSAMARLAGYHKSGRFGPDTDHQFPFNPQLMREAGRIPYSPSQLQEKLNNLVAFSRRAPQLLPDDIRSVEFLERFVREAPLVLQHEDAIRALLNSKTDFVALCHWNVNVDNAWFVRDGESLAAGLLDWGSVGQMNVAQGFYGMTCAAETSFLRQNKAALMERYVAEFRQYGGPAIEVAELSFLYKLSVAVLGIAWIIDAPALIERELPDYHLAVDRYDAKIKNVFLARAQLQVLTVFLTEWLDDDIGTAIRCHFS